MEANPSLELQWEVVLVDVAFLVVMGVETVVERDCELSLHRTTMLCVLPLV